MLSIFIMNNFSNEEFAQFFEKIINEKQKKKESILNIKLLLIIHIYINKNLMAYLVKFQKNN